MAACVGMEWKNCTVAEWKWEWSRRSEAERSDMGRGFSPQLGVGGGAAREHLESWDIVAAGWLYLKVKGPAAALVLLLCLSNGTLPTQD